MQISTREILTIIQILSSLVFGYFVYVWAKRDKAQVKKEQAQDDFWRDVAKDIGELKENSIRGIEKQKFLIHEMDTIRNFYTRSQEQHMELLKMIHENSNQIQVLKNSKIM